MKNFNCVGQKNSFIIVVTGGIAPAGATKGLSDRPLETFGSMLLEFYRKLYFGFPDKHAGVA